MWWQFQELSSQNLSSWRVEGRLLMLACTPSGFDSACSSKAKSWMKQWQETRGGSFLFPFSFLPMRRVCRCLWLEEVVEFGWGSRFEKRKKNSVRQGRRRWHTERVEWVVEREPSASGYHPTPSRFSSPSERRGRRKKKTKGKGKVRRQ